MLDERAARAQPASWAPNHLPAWTMLVVLAVGAALLIAALPIEIAALAVSASIVVVLALIHPVVALGALLAVLPVSTLITVEAGDFAVTAIEPLLLLLVVSWAVHGIVRRDLRVEGGPLLLPLAGVLLAILASTLAAQRLGLAFKEASKWIELTIVFLFTAAYLRERRRRQAILAVLLAAAALEALYGIFQYATGRGPTAFTIGESLRAFGHFDQPNPFAGYLGTVLPIGAALALRRRPRGLALLGAVAAACCGVGILLSLSRGSWIGLAAAAAVMLAAWSSASRRWLVPSVWVLALVVLLTATGVVPGGWSDRLVAVAENFGVFDVRTVELTSENFAVVERMAHWQAGWYMFLEHPWLGVGAGNYPAAYADYSLPGWPEALGHAHNYYLNMAAEAGVLGAVALLVLIGATFRATLSALARHPVGSAERALLLGLLGSVTVLTVHNLFDNLLVHGMQIQVGFVLGLVALLGRAASDQAAGRAQGRTAPSPH